MSNQQKKTDFGLLSAFNANKELNQFGIIFPTAYIIGIIKVLYMHCLNLKLQSPNLKSADRIVQKDPLTTMMHCDAT